MFVDKSNRIVYFCQLGGISFCKTIRRNCLRKWLSHVLTVGSLSNWYRQIFCHELCNKRDFFNDFYTFKLHLPIESWRKEKSDLEEKSFLFLNYRIFIQFEIKWLKFFTCFLVPSFLLDWEAALKTIRLSLAQITHHFVVINVVNRS